MMNKLKISIVIPCYYAERSISEVVTQTAMEFDKQGRYEYSFILVNDGSKDGTYREICKLAGKYDFVIGVDLSKNFGQHNATLAGMKYADGDYILTMDDDFQTHPSQIHILTDKLEEGYDIVYGSFCKKKYSFIKKLGSKLNDLTVRWLIGKPKNLKACPMCLMRRFVRDEIIKSGSAYTNLQGLYLRTSSRIVNADIEHYSRQNGKSGYNLRKLLRLWASFFNYSTKPIRFILSLGASLSAAGMIYLILSLCSAAGLHTLYAEVLLLSGVIVLSLGLIGEYILRMFMAITHEPQYVIRTDTNKSALEELEREEENAYIGCR